MDLQEEKRLIIEELKNVQEEWLILAIKKLLAKEDMPMHHELIIKERLAEYTSGESNMEDWEAIKESL